MALLLTFPKQMSVVELALLTRDRLSLGDGWHLEEGVTRSLPAPHLTTSTTKTPCKMRAVQPFTHHASCEALEIDTL
jgi:hypothetical protein